MSVRWVLDQWDLARDYLSKAVRAHRRQGLPDDGILTIIHRHEYVGLVWSEQPVQPNIRIVRPHPYLENDWLGRPWWWDP